MRVYLRTLTLFGKAAVLSPQTSTVMTTKTKYTHTKNGKAASESLKS